MTYATKPLEIRIENASLSFANKPLFYNLNLTLSAGKWTCLLGPSGVGKSSLLRLIANLSSPNTVMNANIQCNTKHHLTEHIAYMAQQDCLLPWLNIIDNVLVGNQLNGSIANLDSAKKLLHVLGLKEAYHLYPHQLSGGMKQRVALARTLIQNKPIVLMDEPFSAVDAITRFKLQNFAAAHLQNHTVLLITHDPYEALRLGDEIFIMTGQPAILTSALKFTTPKPRNINDPEFAQLHQNLLEQLANTGDIEI